MIRGSASADVRPGGAAATSALSLRSSSVHNTAAMGLEFMCCLNLKQTEKKVLNKSLSLPCSFQLIHIVSLGNHDRIPLITLHSGSLQM